MSTKKSIFTVLVLAASVALFSCASTPVVADNLSASQIVQLGQSAYDRSDYKAALYYYEEVLNRYGTEPSVFVEANYEIGHIYVKTNKKAEAEKKFNAVLEAYNTYGMQIPQQYKKLSQMGLEKIKN